MLIGSRAIAYHNFKFKPKEDADWDIIGTPEYENYFRWLLEIPESGRIEWHDPDKLNNHTLSRLFGFNGVCDPYGLAIIYRSHLHRDHNWDGHLAKYFRYILPLRGGITIHLADPLYLERVKLTKKEYPQGNPNLNQSNMDFFDDKVVKVYDHDYLHELYSYDGRPMYEKLKLPEKMGSAWCEKDLWNNLTELQKLQCVAEETYVIATERFMVPNDWNFNSKQAYYMALRKVCTTLCSGWFRDYAIDNFPKVWELYDNSKFVKVKFLLEAHKAFLNGEPSKPPVTGKQKEILK